MIILEINLFLTQATCRKWILAVNLVQGVLKRTKPWRHVIVWGVRMVECTIQQKALVLLALIIEDLNASRSSKEEIGNTVAVFTASLDSTHRLARLLQLLWASSGFGPANEVAEFSSQLNQKERSSLVRQCSQGEIKVVVCSDGMARGMDIPAIVSVINYDIPGFAKTYVHRCGRTARAE